MVFGRPLRKNKLSSINPEVELLKKETQNPKQGPLALYGIPGVD